MRIPERKWEETRKNGKKQKKEKKTGRHRKNWEEIERNWNKREDTGKHSSYSPDIVLRWSSDRPQIVLR